MTSHRCAEMIGDNFMISAPGGWMPVVVLPSDMTGGEGSARIALTFMRFVPDEEELDVDKVLAASPEGRALTVPVCPCGKLAPLTAPSSHSPPPLIA